MDDTGNISKDKTAYIETPFFSFEGRLPRSKYYIYPLISVVVYLLSLVSGNETIIGFATSFALLYCIIFIFPVVKRIHDLNLSAWFYLIFFIPLLNIIFGLLLLFEEGTKGENKYGHDPL